MAIVTQLKRFIEVQAAQIDRCNVRPKVTKTGMLLICRFAIEKLRLDQYFLIQILNGALVSGPDADEHFIDKRLGTKYTAVNLDRNSVFTAALSAAEFAKVSALAEF